MDRREKEEIILELEELIDRIESEDVEVANFKVHSMEGFDAVYFNAVFPKMRRKKKLFTNPEDYQSLEDDIVGDSLYWSIVRDIVNIPEVPDFLESVEVSDIKRGFSHECCRGCTNNPYNGGSGVCHCTLPYLNFTY